MSGAAGDRAGYSRIGEAEVELHDVSKRTEWLRGASRSPAASWNGRAGRVRYHGVVLRHSDEPGGAQVQAVRRLRPGDSSYETHPRFRRNRAYLRCCTGATGCRAGRPLSLIHI